MAVSCCSLVALYTLFLRRAFRAAGLTPKVIPVDHKTTLHCWVPDFPDESKPAVVLVHGFGPSAEYQWRRQVKYLSKFFNLYVPDLVFFGESTTTSSERSEVFQAKCVSGLMERLGVGRYSVVGTSYGGFVAYHMAKNHGERVEKMVVASSAPNRRRMDNMGAGEGKGGGDQKSNSALHRETAEDAHELVVLQTAVAHAELLTQRCHQCECMLPLLAP